MPEQTPLDLFDPGAVEVTPLPAAEVRRRGDRRRRRRAAAVSLGAAAAVAVVAVAGTGLVDQGRRSAPPAGSPSSPPQSADEWRTDIPSGFPLERGLRAPEGDPISGPGARARGIAPLDICEDDGNGPAQWPGDYVERLAASASGPELLDARELVTFPDDRAATAVLATIRDRVARCGDGDTRWTVHESSGVGDESLTLSRTFELGLGGDVYQLTRVGNAILAVDLGGEWDLGSTVPAGIEDASATSADLVTAMCVFAVEGCDGGPEEPSELPAGLPIGAGMSDPRVFPGRALLAEELELCGERPLSAVDAVDARSARLAGGETSETRTVLLFSEESVADDAQAALVSSAQRCPRGDVPGSEVEVLPGTDGWPGRTIRTTYAGEPPTAMLVHVVRVGPALLLSESYAGAGPDAVTDTRDLIEPQLAALEELRD
ncbi:hypothetical protein [Nocardioides sp. GXQ0305]|uniref:hypothetical protein n=1 Tax=Nocardioides sp. GXQ0305 TaxID=3423912 RepID=UPI003D7CCD89